MCRKVRIRNHLATWTISCSWLLRLLKLVEMFLPVRRHALVRPRTALTGVNIKNALKTHLVPTILKECQTVSVRCIFDFNNEEVVKQLAARRRQLEMKLLEREEVILFEFNMINLDIEKIRIREGFLYSCSA